MNKILVNNGKSIESNILVDDNQIVIKKDDDMFIELEGYNKDINIVILENVRCHIKFIGDNIHSKVNIILEENSYLRIDSLVINSNCELLILLTGRNAECECVNSVMADKNSKIKFTVSHDYESTKSLLVNNGLVLQNNGLIFDVNGIVNKDSKCSICLQDSKIITKYSRLSRILPNLYIENYDVEAEHSAYIGNFSEEDMFYLMSRGISRNDAYLLLVKSFLIGKMIVTEEEEKKLMAKIDEYVRKGDRQYES